jgi:hypothetical protein
LPWPSSNHDPLDLYLLSNWDYRCEQQCLAFIENFYIYVHLVKWSIIFAFVMSLSVFCIWVILAYKRCLVSFLPFLLCEITWESCVFFCKGLVSSSNETMPYLLLQFLLGFSLWKDALLLLQFHYLFLVCLSSLYSLNSVLVDHMYLEIYPFLIHFPVYWNKNFWSFPNDPLNLISICCDITSFISNFIN